MKTLYLVRGIPGSGKSTFAKSLQIPHFEADMFFEDKEFNTSLLKDAHAWCQEQANWVMIRGIDLVISNTFVKRWEMEPYYKFAEAYGYTVYEIIMNGKFQSVHNVPIETIERMKNNFEY